MYASAIITTDSAARDSGVSAAGVLKVMLPAVDGRGGGSAEMSQGGGANVAGLEASLSAAAAGIES